MEESSLVTWVWMQNAPGTWAGNNSHHWVHTISIVAHGGRSIMLWESLSQEGSSELMRRLF